MMRFLMDVSIAPNPGVRQPWQRYHHDMRSSMPHISTRRASQQSATRTQKLADTGHTAAL